MNVFKSNMLLIEKINIKYCKNSSKHKLENCANIYHLSYKQNRCSNFLCLQNLRPITSTVLVVLRYCSDGLIKLVISSVSENR